MPGDEGLADLQGPYQLRDAQIGMGSQLGDDAQASDVTQSFEAFRELFRFTQQIIRHI